MSKCLQSVGQMMPFMTKTRKSGKGWDKCTVCTFKNFPLKRGMLNLLKNIKSMIIPTYISLWSLTSFNFIKWIYKFNVSFQLADSLWTLHLCDMGYVVFIGSSGKQFFAYRQGSRGRYSMCASSDEKVYRRARRWWWQRDGR